MKRGGIERSHNRDIKDITIVEDITKDVTRKATKDITKYEMEQ